MRSKTVEPVLGTLINFLSMKKINSRGIKQAKKHVLMLAMTYDLKKYMKFIVKIKYKSPSCRDRKRKSKHFSKNPIV